MFDVISSTFSVITSLSSPEILLITREKQNKHKIGELTTTKNKQFFYKNNKTHLCDLNIYQKLPQLTTNNLTWATNE